MEAIYDLFWERPWRLALIPMALCLLFGGVVVVKAMIAAWPGDDTMLCSGSAYTACTDGSPSYTDHGYSSHNGVSYWGSPAGHDCNNYVAYVVSTVNGTGRTWYYLGSNYESTKGYVVNNTPAVGSVAEWDDNYHGAGPTGHVAYVESVNADGSITISEDNYPSGPFDWRTISAGSGSWPSRFVHIGDLVGGGG
jgi:surface antigen